jgi:hypothetical protein
MSRTSMKLNIHEFGFCSTLFCTQCMYFRRIWIWIYGTRLETGKGKGSYLRGSLERSGRQGNCGKGRGLQPLAGYRR